MGTKKIAINWLLKAALFKIISGLRIYFLPSLLSKYLTGRGEKIFSDSFEDDLNFHVRNIDNYQSRELLEIGGGRSLVQNIFISKYGVRQTVIDRYWLLDFSLVSDAATNFRGRKTKITQISDLKTKYAIEYLAPCDVSDLEGGDKVFDFFLSTNTFEHLRVDELKRLLHTLSKILEPKSVLSLIIDYSDHFSHTDPNIGPLHFLRYSKTIYNLIFNSKMHYQNRLRHYDYSEIFVECGYSIITDEALGESSPPSVIKSIKRDIDKNDFFAKGRFLLRVPV